MYDIPCGWDAIKHAYQWRGTGSSSSKALKIKAFVNLQNSLNIAPHEQKHRQMVTRRMSTVWFCLVKLQWSAPGFSGFFSWCQQNQKYPLQLFWKTITDESAFVCFPRLKPSHHVEALQTNAPQIVNSAVGTACTTVSSWSPMLI